MGLSISKGFIGDYGGKYCLNKELKNTCFVFTVAKSNAYIEEKLVAV